MIRYRAKNVPAAVAVTATRALRPCVRPIAGRALEDAPAADAALARACGVEHATLSSVPSLRAEAR